MSISFTTGLFFTGLVGVGSAGASWTVSAAAGSAGTSTTSAVSPAGSTAGRSAPVCSSGRYL